jgi:hypothetical protein
MQLPEHARPYGLQQASYGVVHCVSPDCMALLTLDLSYMLLGLLIHCVSSPTQPQTPGKQKVYMTSVIQPLKQCPATGGFNSTREVLTLPPQANQEGTLPPATGVTS